MIPKELCHYTKRDTALEKILFGGKIRLGLLGLTNDPKESKWNPIAALYPENYMPKHEEMIQLGDEAQRVSKEEWKVLCMSQHFAVRKYKEETKNTVISKFRHGYSRPRMWAQYAENHSGVCLIFDGKKLHANIESALNGRCKIFSGSVTYKNYGAIVSELFDYSDILRYGLSEGVRAHYYKHYKHYFLSKYPDWKNESEYRWLVHSPSNAPEFVNIEGALKAVVIGSDFPKVYETAMIEVCKKLKASIGRMNWSNGMPSFDLKGIYDPNNA